MSKGGFTYEPEQLLYLLYGEVTKRRSVGQSWRSVGRIRGTELASFCYCWFMFLILNFEKQEVYIKKIWTFLPIWELSGGPESHLDSLQSGLIYSRWLSSSSCMLFSPQPLIFSIRCLHP